MTVQTTAGWEVIEAWVDAFDGEMVEGEAYCDISFPDEALIERFLRKLPLDEVIDAVGSTRRRWLANHCRGQMAGYFVRTCLWKIYERAPEVEA